MAFDRLGPDRCCCPICDCETRGCVCPFNWGFTSEDDTLGDLPTSRFLGHYIGNEDYFDSIEWSIMMWWDNCSPVQKQSGTLFALWDSTRAFNQTTPSADPATEIRIEQAIDLNGKLIIQGTIQTYGNDLIRDDEFSIVLPGFFPYSQSSAASSCKMIGLSYRRSLIDPDYNFLNIYYNDQDLFNNPPPGSGVDAEAFLEQEGDPSVDPIPLNAGDLWRPGGGVGSGSFQFNVGVARSDYPPALGDGSNRFNRLFDGCGSHLTIWKDFNTLADWRAEFNNGIGSIPLAKTPFEHWCPTEPAICGTAGEEDRNQQIGDNGRVLHLMAYERDDDCELILDSNDQPILALA